VQKLTLTIAFLCVLCIVGLSQEERQYTFCHYGTDKGLASYEVRSVVQDETGYLWIGTITGLQRFDGTRFITFYHRKNDSSGLPDNHIVQLLRDKKNNLWVLTASGRLGIFDRKHFRFKEVAVKLSKAGSLLADKKLFLNSQGSVFLLCFRNELLVYNENNNSFSSADHIIPLPAKWNIISFCEQVKQGKYYIGTDSGMVVFNNRTKTLSYAGHNVEKEPLINQLGQVPYVAPMLLDSKQRLWIMSWHPAVGSPEFFCFNLHTNKVILHKYSFMPLVKEYHEPGGMIEQRNGAIWIRGSSLFARFLEKENTFQLVHNGYQNDQSIAFEMLHDLHEDREENLWVATNNNGLYRFNPSKEYFLNVRHINRAKNTPGEGSALSFASDNNGTFLMGAWGNGIYRYDSAFKNIPVNIKGIIEKNSVVVWNMHPGRNGHSIWMGTQPGGIYHYDQITKKATYYDVPAIEHSTVRQITEDKNGNLWLGTHTRGLFKCTKTSTGLNFNNNVEKIAAVDARTITALCTDNAGNLWVATTSNGVYLIDVNNNQVIHHFTIEGPLHQRLTNMAASSVFIYNDTTIIIGAGGLNIYNPRTEKIKQVQLPLRLPNNVAAMQKDRNGYLWVTQSSGLFRLSPDKTNIFVLFDRIDGIINDHFMVGASLALPDGRLVFGSSNQFIVFNPQKIEMANSLPDVTLTGFKVRNKSLSVDSLLNLQFIELAPDQNAVTIDMSALVYLSPSLIKYKLEGIDNDWMQTDLSSQAIYPYLPPGTYTFMAKTVDSEGTPGKNVTTLIIKVKPHFWQTWWFFGLIVFAGLGIFLWIDKMRVQKIKATESVRSRIAQSLTEDMSNSLSSINITSELAKTKVDTDKERTREYINQISEASNRMVQAMYDMVWSINPDNDTLLYTVERMKSYAAELQTQYDADIIFQVDDDAADIHLPMEARYEMLSIFKEAVNNAARHAHAKYIEVNIRYKKPALTLCIQDDGKGFDVELVELSRGLSEMRRRANTINATFTIKSEINTGTMVKLTIHQ
jgi:ligand-binding sensor domain-containing protein/two-component sensor histidine kinase